MEFAHLAPALRLARLAELRAALEQTLFGGGHRSAA
ncbi:hypothetical protein H4W79_002505 [Nocardiopsis terrae]|uniref:Uncharacterized protein n=1 Tax=Nocardiopsis terrae TaxID=372655 RepID=A0ABR9HH83_9ACTN|nr:hypothetical protein [Nocardiopsis terrae]